MAGRPKYKFTDEQIAKIDDLASLNCKDYTIAEVIGCDVATLKTHFSKRLIQKRAEGRAKLRQYQWEMAKTHPVMDIWLGKQPEWLGQTDKQEVTHGVTDDLGVLLLKIGKTDDLRPESDAVYKDFSI